MTGYGKSQNTFNFFEVTIEIKSVNNRYIDIMFKLPSIISHFEPQLRETVKENAVRGKISVFIDIKEVGSGNNGSTVNEKRLMHYFNTLNEIKTKLKLQDPIELRHLLQFQELFDVDISNIDEKEFFAAINNTLLEALKAFNEMRSREGTNLGIDIKNRLLQIRDISSKIDQKAPENVKTEYEKLVSRINEILTGQKVDQDRMLQEIAIISDKVDITEELTRLKSHIQQFEHTLKDDSELGKKLTFILQEMHREANTMSSKTTDVEISHQVIKIKEEIEKIREQAQNLE